MIKLLILTIFAFLTNRLISKAFDSFERLVGIFIAKGPRQQLVINRHVNQTKQQIKRKGVISPAKNKISKQKQLQHAKNRPSKNKQSSSQKITKLKYQSQRIFQNQPLYQQNQAKIKDPTNSMKSSQQQNNLEQRSRLEIQQIRKDVERYKYQKINYITQISEMIQSVISPSDQIIKEQQQQSEDQVLNIIYQLKMEINNAFRLQQNKKQQLQEAWKKETEEIIVNYEQKIEHLQKKNTERQSDKNKLLNKISTLQLQHQRAMKQLETEKVQITAERIKSPFQRPIIKRTILEGSNSEEIFFGQTRILSQKKRDFIIIEINRLKRIASQKTKLLHRYHKTNSKPISDFTSNVPNILIIFELANQKIIAAFSQTAFSKQLDHSIEKSKFMSQNKSMIMDISEEKVFINQSGHETIQYGINKLIWGRNQLVLNYIEPPMISCHLNCQNAIYPCQYSSEELLGNKVTCLSINQYEVFRIFSG